MTLMEVTPQMIEAAAEAVHVPQICGRFDSTAEQFVGELKSNAWNKLLAPGAQACSGCQELWR
jgi:hypothetical protein